MKMRGVFVGRKEEIEQIDDLVFSLKNHILPLVGDGGSGKTHLLNQLNKKYNNVKTVQKLNKKYKQQIEPLIIRIDLYESHFQSLPNIILAWLDQLSFTISEEDIKEFRTQISKLNRISEWFSNMDEIKDAEEQAYQYALDIFAQFSTHQRIIILLDTLETSTSSQFHNQLISFISNLSNFILILSGRPEAQFFSDLEKYKFGNLVQNWVIHESLSLNPFTKEEVANYYKIVFQRVVKEDDCEKTTVAAHGNPVLIAIMGEWLSRDAKLPDSINNIQLEELLLLDEKEDKKELVQLQKRFESELISGVLNLLEPTLQRILLYSSYLNRRTDPEIFKVTLNIKNKNQLTKVMRNFNRLVFVRDSILTKTGQLHDEVTRLILTYIWPIEDPAGIRRQNLATEVVNKYYEEKIFLLEDKIREQLRLKIEFSTDTSADTIEAFNITEEEILKRNLQVESLDYQFRSSPHQAWNYLDILINEARVESSYLQAEMIKQAMKQLQLEKIEPVRFLVSLARINLIENDYLNAEDNALLALKKMGEDSLQDKEVDISCQANAHMVLGIIEPRVRDKISFFSTAKSEVENSNLNQLDSAVLKQLGLAYRKEGKWKEAAEAYQRAIQTLDRETYQDEYAAILNNLAFVLLLDGQPYKADNIAEQALFIRKERANIYALSLSFSTKGRIVEALSDHARAQRYYKIAEKYARDRGDDDFASLCSVNLATAKIIERNFDEARELVQPGFQNRNKEYRARAFHQAAKIDLMEGKQKQRQENIQEANDKFKEARKNAKIGLSFAHSIGNYPLQASILYDLALLDHLQYKYKTSEYIRNLEKILTTFDLKHEKGRLQELKGDIKFSSGKHSEAFDDYLKACDTLSNFSPAAFYDTFDRIRQKYLQCSRKEQLEIEEKISAKVSTEDTHYLLNALASIAINHIGYMEKEVIQ